MVLIYDLFVSGVLWGSIWGTYPVNSYMVSELFEGRVRWWSKSKASRTTSDFCFLDLLFLTTFKLRGLLFCVGSICSNEEPLSFHAKMFLIALAMSILRSRGIQCLFAVYSYFLSVYFGFSLFSLFYYRIYTFHFWVCSLPHDSVRSRQIRNRKEGFFSCVCSFPLYLSVISENQKHWGKYLVSS